MRLQTVLIARVTGWSRAEILSLPLSEFTAYAQLLTPPPEKPTA